MASKYSYYQLRMACQQHMMASLYTEPDDPDAFSAGYVEAVTQRHVLLWAVTAWGQFDGWCLQRTEDVQQVFMGDDYEVRLQMLLEMEDARFEPLLTPAPQPDEDLLCRLLQHAQKTAALVSVMTSEDTYTGRVLHIDDLRASIDVLDFFGVPEGEKQLPLREMRVVTYGTQEERMYQRLYDERLKLV